jgi:hypothetical protein
LTPSSVSRASTLQGRARTAAGGRPGTDRGRLRPSSFHARMAAALANHRRPHAGMGAQAFETRRPTGNHPLGPVRRRIQPRGASGNPDDQDKRGDREPSHERQCCQRRQQRLPQHFDRPWKASTRAGTFEPLLTAGEGPEIDRTGLPGRMWVTLGPTKPGLRGLGSRHRPQGSPSWPLPPLVPGVGERPGRSQVAGRRRSASELLQVGTNRSGWPKSPARV